MQYTNKSFSVSAPSTQEYRDNWDRTFGKPAAKSTAKQVHERYKFPELTEEQQLANQRYVLDSEWPDK